MMLEMTGAGLYCPAGDFHIDPSGPVRRAVITHAHADHACPGSQAYLTAEPGAALVRERLGPATTLQAVPYSERLTMGDVTVSLHPAGHILGSAQVRIERGGEVWVVSGDYKLQADTTCAPFEPLRCDTFVTESTFALPVFRWPDAAETLAGISAWWQANREHKRMSILFATPLGKAQRLLAGLDGAVGPVFVHESVERYCRIYREQGIALPPVRTGRPEPGSLVIAHPGWEPKFPAASRAMASGWMRIRGPRRRRALDRGFVLSDHADWPALLAAIGATEAGTVWPVHGYTAALSRWLAERGQRTI